MVCEGTSHGEHHDGPWRAGVPEWGAGRWCDVFEIRDWKIQRCFIYLDPDYAGQDTQRYVSRDLRCRPLRLPTSQCSPRASRRYTVRPPESEVRLARSPGSGPREVEETEAVGGGGGFAAAVHAELAEDIGHMHAGGLRRDE